MERRGKSRGNRRHGLSMLELQVATIVLATGLAALGSLLATHSRQIHQAESWCTEHGRFYTVPHASKWMRLLKPPAELTSTPAQEWEAGVELGEAEDLYQVEVLEQTLDASRQARTALVTHQPPQGN